MRIPFPHPDHEWQPVSKAAVIGWGLFYLVAMYLYRPSGAHFLDAAHLITHESGHLLFSYLGNETITVMGGTILQLLAPLLLAASFAWRGQTLGTAFCMWGFFNAMIPMGVYMSDARAKGLPLVAPGMVSDEITGHD